VRYLLFAVLASVPLALAGWIGWRGHAGSTQQSASAASTAPSPADPDAALLALFEGEPASAKLKEKVALYDAQTLFDYVDGAAPTFIQRGFRKLGAAEMSAGGGELTCDVYDMAAPANAEAIFTAERSSSAKSAPGWPEAITGSKSFVFRRGRYYVKLTAFDAKAEAALPELARALRGRMP